MDDEQKPLTFAIVGAGAVGLYYGARLVEAGQEVRFLLRSDLEVVKEDGITVESVDGDLQLPEVICSDNPEDLGPVDVVMVAWKTTSNHHFEEVISPLRHDKTVVLTLQNGLGSAERLRELFGKNKVLAAICFVCLNRIGNGYVRHTAGGMIALGGPEPWRTRLGDIFERAKFPCTVIDDLPLAQWRKLVWNIPFNGLCIAEGGITTKELLEKPGGEKHVRALMSEVIVGAKLLGHEIPETFIDEQIVRTHGMDHYKPSSLIDYLNDREVELDSIWGEPLRQIEAAGGNAPVLAELHQKLTYLTTS